MIYRTLLLFQLLFYGYLIVDTKTLDIDSISPLQDYVIPINYNILLIPITEDTFYSEIILKVNITAVTQKIHLRMFGIIGATLSNPIKTDNKVLGYVYQFNKHFVELRFIRQIEPYIYDLHMQHVGIINKEFINVPVRYSTYYENEEGKVIGSFGICDIWVKFNTNFSTVHICRFNDRKYLSWKFNRIAPEEKAMFTSLDIFPYWGESRLKPAFNITFSYPLKPREFLYKTENYTVENGMIWKHVLVNNSVKSSHLAAVFISDFAEKLQANSIRSISYSMWHNRSLERNLITTFDIIVNVITYLRSNMTLKVNLAMQHVVIPEYQEAYIWQGSECILYRETDVSISTNDSITRHMEVTRFVTYKIIRHIFDDTFSWLNEGLIIFLQAYVIDKIFPEYRMMDLFTIQNQFESLKLTFNNSDIKSCNVDRNCNFAPYVKAPFLFRMLQHVISTEVFLKGVEKYVNTRKSIPQIDADIYTSMQAAVDESDSTLKERFNISDIMDSWIIQEVVLVIKRHYYYGWTYTVLENLNPSDDHNWYVPITYTTKEHLAFDNINITNIRWMKYISPELLKYDDEEIREGDWIIANLQQTGYYRVRYDEINWQDIAKYLNSEEYAKIHVLNRAQIINDAFYFMINRQINSYIFWNIANYLSRETNYVAWYPMIKALEYLSNVFPLSDERVVEIKRRILVNLNSVLRVTGYSNIYNDTANIHMTFLRQEVRRWACVIGDSDCHKAAAEELLANNGTTELYFKNSEWWDNPEWVICNALMVNDTIWNKVHDSMPNYIARIEEEGIWMKQRKVRILRLFACGKTISTIRKYLKIMKGTRKIIGLDHDYHIFMFFSLIQRHANNSTMLDYILNMKNYYLTVPSEINNFQAFAGIINHVHSSFQLQKISNFVKTLCKSGLCSNYPQRFEWFIGTKIKIREKEISNQIKSPLISAE